MKKVKSICILLLVSIMLLSLVACAQEQAPAAPPAADTTTAPADDNQEPVETAPADDGEVAPPEDMVTLLMWYWDNDVFAASLEGFFANRPGLEIEFIDVPGNIEFVNRFTTAMATGLELPDIVAMEQGFVQRLGDLEGVLEVLTDPPYNFDTSFSFDYLIPMLTNTDGYINRAFGVVCASGVAFKRGMALEFFGTDDVDEVEAILSDWYAVAQVGSEIYEQSGGTRFLFATIDHINLILMGQNRIPIVSPDGVISREAITNIFNILVMMKENNVFDPELSGWGDVWASAVEDIHMLYACAPWVPRHVLKHADPDRVAGWGVIEPPGGGFNWGGLYLGVSSTSNHKSEAWEVIEWLSTSEEAARWWLEEAGEIINNKAFASDRSNFDGLEDPYFAGQNVVKKLLDIADNMEILPLTKFDPSIGSAMGAGIHALVMEGASIEEIVDIVVNELEMAIFNLE